MTLPPIKSLGKRKQTGVFDYTEEDEQVEEMSRKLVRKFSPETKNSSGAIAKYDFLRLFSKGNQMERKEVDHIVIDVEASTTEVMSSCEINGYGISDVIDVTSDGSFGRIGRNLSISSSVSKNDEALNGEEVTSSVSDSVEADSKDLQLLIIPDVIIYGDIYCASSPRLTFTPNGMNVESSSVNATTRTFSCQWKIEDFIRIESQWCLEVETAIVNVLLKSRDLKGADNEEEISGIDLLKFSVYDPKWSKKVETIKLLDSKYNDIWFDTITESEETGCGGQNLGTSLTNLADEFEDLVYPQGEPDAVVVRKQDIELLKPRRFINDTIIDFYIMYLKSRIPPAERGRFHFFNCFFFRKLANLDKGSPSTIGGKEAYQRVKKWTKNVDLFDKDYIFVPINCSFHWSLIIICHPGELVPSHVENPTRVPCILHLDSIKGSHKGGLVNIFPSYLNEEWKARHGKTTTDFSRPPNMQLISLELPQQENSFDCGLFLLHYLDLFVSQAPTKFNPSLIKRSSNFLTRNWFPAKEASLKRGYILELLYSLHKGHDPSILPPHCGVSSMNNDQENESEDVTEISNWRRKPFDDIPQTSRDLILSKENFYKGGCDAATSSKCLKVFMSPIVEEVQETHLPMEDIQESIGKENEDPLRKEECLLCIEDSDDDEEMISVDYVSDSQESCEVEVKEEDGFLLVHRTGEKIKSSIRKGAVNKSRDSAAATSCYNNNNIILVLSDDETSPEENGNLYNVMATKRPRT